MAELHNFQRAQLNWLLGRLESLSDPRSQSANQLADELTKKAFELVTRFFQSPDPGHLDSFLKQHFEIEPDRLPSNATFEEQPTKFSFVTKFGAGKHSLDTRLASSTSAFIRTRYRLGLCGANWTGHGPALGSNIVDLALAVFALYLDYVQVDKRIFDSAGQAATTHRLLLNVQPRVFRTTGSNYEKLYK